MTIYYIDPAGNDTTGTGTIGNPWKTLYKACVTVTVAGDMIHINSGDYIESTQCPLGANISIEGVGDSSRIISHKTGTDNWDHIILLSAESNTLQTISYIKLDGDSLTGGKGIGVARSNVYIHHCTIVNFNKEGVKFSGTGLDNKFYDNTLTNCGGQPDHKSNLYIGGQTNLLIYNNTITQTARAVSENGNCIGGYEACYGTKIYDNVITATPYLEDGVWKFAVEIWQQRGLEMYGNTIKGEVD